MATEKQRRAAEIMVENGGNASAAMRAAGYSPQTAKSPHKLTDSKGFLELCDELGLTENLLVQALVADIKANPGKRVPELQLGARMRGLLVDRTDITTKGKELPAPILGSASHLQPDDSDQEAS